jgi:hypothetical protein
MTTSRFRVWLLPNPPLEFEPETDVWRDIEVDGSHTLTDFHEGIFEAFDRWDSHAYEFLTRDEHGIATRSYTHPRLYEERYRSHFVTLSTGKGVAIGFSESYLRTIRGRDGPLVCERMVIASPTSRSTMTLRTSRGGSVWRPTSPSRGTLEGDQRETARTSG